MLRKTSRLLVLLFFLNVMVSCASSVVPVSTEAPKGIQPSRVEARKFEEVELTTIKGDILRGKIISLEEESIEFRSFPYWNIDPIKLNLDEIHSIKLLKEKSGAIKGLGNGFGWTFLIFGSLGALTSRYNVDYQWRLIGSAIFGGAGGLVGLTIGALRDAGAKTKFDFYQMSGVEKKQIVRKIMGF